MGLTLSNKAKNITGERYGLLTVVEASHVSNESVFWSCSCDCGNSTVVRGTELRRNRNPTRSCGCLQSESSRKRAGVACLKKRKYQDNEVEFIGIRRHYTRTANYRKIPFSLTDQELMALSKSDCHYCSSSPGNVQTMKRVGQPPIVYQGLDRLDSNLGYHTGNVVPCCRNCNVAKASMAEGDFYRFVAKLYSSLKEKGLLNGIE